MSILTKKQNIHSQNGEDGIIEYIFTKLNIERGNFIEFGAWDGKFLSNTYNLFNKGWGGIYIEGDYTKYVQLKQNFCNHKHITCINKMVGFNQNDNLDTIIDESDHANKEFDLVSIDVDGLDYYILKAMNKYLPKVICIEVNAGHSPHYDKEIDINLAKNNIGQSIHVMCEMAKQKDYFPLCYTGNLFLIQNKYKNIFNSDIKTNEDIYIDFLIHLDTTNPGGLKYLYNLFVIKKYYNDFLFENDILKSFCVKYHL